MRKTEIRSRGKMKIRVLMLTWVAVCFGPQIASCAIQDYASLFQQSIQQYVPSWLTTSAAPSVRILQGRLLGTVLDDGTFPAPVEAFTGVPYALPPVGELRFARPVPVPASERTIDASKYGPRCPGRQLLEIPGSDSQNEDCLTANVFRPSNATSNSRLPVAVYVHGGAFNRGSAKMHNTASMVAWSAEPFIAISFNYRIGAPGFLNSAVTQSEGVVNLGLRDQILLLEWVQDNIAAFGGDPDCVTLLGLSAGAHSIGHHIMNINSEKQLFHRIVIESGGPTSRALHPYNSQLHEEQFQVFLSEVGCLDKPVKRIMECLREAPSAKIIEASNEVFMRWNPSVRWAWQPVIDNDIISRRPTEAWESGNWKKVPILTGFNHNEGTMYVPRHMDHADDFEDFFATLLPQLSTADIKELAALYPDPATYPDSPYVESRQITVGNQYKRIEAAYGHYAYVCPVRQTVHLGTASKSDPPIYLYHWALNRTVLGGANHADQMSYETVDPDIRAISPSQEEIAGTFHAYITSFIVSGEPNKVAGRFGQRPRWEVFEEGNKKTMLFGMGNDERAGGDGIGVIAQLVEDNWARDECDFWWKKSYQLED